MRTAVFYVPNEIQPADGLWQSIAEISSLYCNDDAAERDLRRQAYPAAAAQSRAEQSGYPLCVQASFSPIRNLSAIIAINSLLVGFPRSILIV